MATQGVYNWPVPLDSDRPAGGRQMRELAAAIEATLTAVKATADAAATNDTVQIACAVGSPPWTGQYFNVNRTSIGIPSPYWEAAGPGVRCTRAIAAALITVNVEFVVAGDSWKVCGSTVAPVASGTTVSLSGFTSTGTGERLRAGYSRGATGSLDGTHVALADGRNLTVAAITNVIGTLTITALKL